MEPVTHVLTGLCLARSGLNRRAAYATAGMAIAAEFPDIDTLWGLRGSVSGFEHHRGITHTFAGIPFEAAFLLLGFFLWHRIRRPRDLQHRESRLATANGRSWGPPVRWGVLYFLLLTALLSHLLLDYTNNYGLRPLFPFDTHWFAASIVFIFDPLLFVILLAGLLLPFLFGLIGQEVGARPEAFRGRAWARAALLGVLLFWAVRWIEHGRAVHLAAAQTLRAPGTADSASGSTLGPLPPVERPLLFPQRALASPDPLSVFRWYTVTDFGPAYRLGTADTRNGALEAGPLLNKPPLNAAIEAALRSHLGRIYLDWSPVPLLGVVNGNSDDAAGQPDAEITVTFRDPRFMGDLPLLRERGLPPLTGEVVLDQENRVIDEGMDGRFEH